jgi:acid phosphatase type 7
MPVTWFRDRATATIALGAATAAAVGLAVTVGYVLPRAATQDDRRATATPTVTTFVAEADTYVEADTADVNYGTSDQIVVDSTPQRRVFLRFTVTGLNGPVTRAVLRLHTIAGNAGSSGGGTWRAMTDTTWSETDVTWDEQPEIDRGMVAVLGPVVNSEWYELDVTSMINGNGTYSIAGTSTDSDGAYFDTRETASFGPRLVVTTG